MFSFYTGNYTENPQDNGIHLIQLSPDNGKLHYIDSYYGAESPSFLIRKGEYLYAANEIGSAGKVSALSVNADKSLLYLNSVEVAGAHTCHITEMNGYIYAANYSSGSIFGVKIPSGGFLGKVVAEIRHEGSGPNPSRQKSPHAHSVNHTPCGILIAADLGADKLFRYRQQKDGSLVPDLINPSVAAPAGGGPRHMVFHPSLNRAYVVMEMGVSLACYMGTREGMRLVAEYPLLADAITEADTAADVHFASNGTRLYATTRGKDLISAFDVAADGALKLIGSYPTFGNSPRNFCFSPDEAFILISHQVSGHVSVCPVDKKSGAVCKAISSIIIPGVSCVINA